MSYRYCCPLYTTWGQYSGKIRFIEYQGVNGHRRPVTRTPSSGMPRERERSCRYQARVVRIRGKFVLSTNPGCKTRVSPCFIELQRVSDHRRPLSGSPSSCTPRESQAKLFSHLMTKPVFGGCDQVRLKTPLV